MDAAYMGDWGTLLKVTRFAIRRFANCTRLRPNPDSKTPWRPSSYTALHQAAWHGAPIEIVQGLIELGSSRQCILSLPSSDFTLLFDYRWP
jgi:hypothetical protein